MTATPSHDFSALLQEEDPDYLEDLLEILTGISGLFASSLDIEETMRVCVSNIRLLLQAEAASLFLLDPSGNTLLCRACSGPVEVTGLQLPLLEGIVGRAVREGRVQMVPDVLDDPDFYPEVDACTGFVTRSILCTPLKFADRVLGALEVINKHSPTQLFTERDRAILAALANSAALALHNARQAVILRERDQMHHELQLARTLQETFLPPRQAPGFPAHGLSLAARMVAGDFFDLIPRSDGEIFFALGDVSGKGLDAGLLMAKCASLTRHLARCGHEPAELLRLLNEELEGSARMGRFVTMAAGIYHPGSGRALLANAGHPPPFLLHVGDETLEELPGSAPPLGIERRFPYDQQEIPLQGNRLYLYSDGVTEAQRPGGGMLGAAGLGRAILETTKWADTPLDRLEGLARRLDQLAPRYHDDLTLLLVDGTRGEG